MCGIAKDNRTIPRGTPGALLSGACNLVSHTLLAAMPNVREYQTSDGMSPFSKWFFRLEAHAAAKVRRKILKLESGLRSDTKAVGEGVFEARIDYGPGYRIYFGLDGITLIILLGGGSKKGQQDDIDHAHRAWADYKSSKTQRIDDHGTYP